jgi:SagB-type dehydrogenase family enzyme
MDDLLKTHREFLKDTMRARIDFSQTDQARGVPAPPVQKPYPEDAKRIPLPAVEQWREEIKGVNLLDALGNRRSRRRFTDEPLSLDELSFVLWATQGIRLVIRKATSMRTVPSAGARHCFETYLLVNRVSGIEQGLYRYLPMENELLAIKPLGDIAPALTAATLDQDFVATAPVCLVWAAIPYRTEWRYGLSAHRVILMDAGHICQNLYIACEAIGAATCAVAAYNQEAMDRLIEVDGTDEFTVYLAPVGKPDGTLRR